MSIFREKITSDLPDIIFLLFANICVQIHMFYIVFKFDFSLSYLLPYLFFSVINFICLAGEFRRLLFFLRLQKEKNTD